MADRGRQNLMLMAAVRWQGGAQVRVRVCDISRGGAKIRAAPFQPAGAAVEIELANLGWIAGTVAWVAEHQFGIHFAHDIDPAVVRKPVSGSYRQPAGPVAPNLRYVA